MEEKEEEKAGKLPRNTTMKCRGVAKSWCKHLERCVCLFVDCCSARRTDCWADRGLGEDYNTDFCHSLCDLYHLGLLTNQPRILEIFSLLKQRFCFISIITIKAPIALLTAAGNILFSDLPSGKTRIRQLPTAKILFCKLTGCSLNSPN